MISGLKSPFQDMEYLLFGNSWLHRNRLMRSVQDSSCSIESIATGPLSPILISFHYCREPMSGCGNSLLFRRALRSAFHFFRILNGNKAKKLYTCKQNILGFFLKKTASSLFYRCMHCNKGSFNHVGTQLANNLHTGYLNLLITAMSDHSPYFNHVFIRRPFSDSVMKNILFHTKKIKIT